MSRGRIVPISRPLLVGAATPVDLLRRMRGSGEECFLLESVEGAEAVARYSFLGVAPSARLTARGARVEIEREGKRRESRVPLLEALDALTLRERYEPDPDLPPFCGGSVGYLSYDAARLFETLPDRHPRVSGMPDALFLRFDAVVAFDHAGNRVLAITTAEEGDSDRASARLDALEGFVRSAPHPDLPAARFARNATFGRGRHILSARGDPSRSLPARGERAHAARFIPSMPKEEFLAAVVAAKEAILAGEVYQAVLSQRWTARLSRDPLDVYEELRALNPSPYLFYLHTREADVFGASPEMLVRCRGRNAETRPIAGTIRRGSDAAEDEQLAASMLADPKERAEHVMLVDLGRNDLGRVCEIGTVEVGRYADVERYSHVQHLVSDVSGTLAAGRSSTEALASCFPAGTLTGAPKIRAMELIDELECCRRGIYGGAVGYLDCGGNLDMAIAIRTAVVEKGECRIQAGAGIVADSEPEKEYREAESKAQALFRAVELAGK
jgi:anthranilate synthase component I